MSNSYFEFKQFVICHDKCAMKVGTDGVLLGAWTEVESGVRRLLDIGTGSGLIAIMLAQKCGAEIVGIDIDSDAAKQAQSNADISPWKERIQVFQADVRSFAPKNSFDLIVCNPPFFTESLLCPDRKRNEARHNDSLPFDVLIHKVSEWLSNNGLFNVILPAKNLDMFIQCAWESDLNLYRKCLVSSKPDLAPKRILLSFRKGPAPYPASESLVVRNVDGTYTDEYKRLTKDYYLYF